MYSYFYMYKHRYIDIMIYIDIYRYVYVYGYPYLYTSGRMDVADHRRSQYITHRQITEHTTLHFGQCFTTK